MKRLRSLFRANWMISLLLLSLVFMIGCGAPVAGSADVQVTPAGVNGLSSEEATTLDSLELVDDYPLYTMRYHGAYDAAVADWATTPSLSWGCSLFAVLGDMDNALYGRNFDWEYSPALLLFTDPPDGYASASMVDIAYLGFEPPEVQTLVDLPLVERQALLRAPSLPFDGFNERGLTVGMAAVPAGNVTPDPNKETIGSLVVIREMLDHAANVEEAISIIQSYNVDFGDGPPLHYLVADLLGHSALIEFYRGEMVVTFNESDWCLATNFLRASVGESAEGACWRYDRINRRLVQAQGRLATQDALDLLAQVAQGNTQWSIVYGMSTGDVSVVMGREYDDAHTLHLALDP